MAKIETENEFQTLFHLFYLAVLSVFATLLLLVVMMFGTSGWLGLAIILSVISCWIVHFVKPGSQTQRLYYYVIISILGLVVYGCQPNSLTDVPLVICLFIIMLSPAQKISMIYMVALTYPACVLWHLFVLHTIESESDGLLLSRIGLGIVSLIAAIIISRFFLRKQMADRQMQENTESRLDFERQENERFLANVSHELRTPINVVNGMSEIILRRELDSGMREDVQVIQNAGKRLFMQVSDILDYSELMTGNFIISEENYEPLSMINDAVMNVMWHKMPPHLDFAIDIQPDIPKVLCGDVDKIRKIIIALTDNAMKFTEDGGAYLYISKRDEAYGINLNIDIWDTGCGISEEERRHLFSTFYKGDSGIERRTGGLGLGLAIVHGMVTAMGGFLSIDSKPQIGTHVHVTIPQKVQNKQKSISVKNAQKFKIACYFNKEKYTRVEVAEYYYRMIANIRNELGMPIAEADSFEQLKEILAGNEITHVFVARWEYELDKQYFEQIGENYHVIVFVDAQFTLPESSKVNILKKPVYMLSVVNILNATAPGASVQLKKEERTMYNAKALVVDDDNMNLTVAKGILKMYGIEADTCFCGELALEKCMLIDYDIVFMDYMMPAMNGIETMHRIRELRKGFYEDIPIVVLTANAVSGAREMFYEEGFDEFLSKPIELSEMSRVLRKTLKRGTEIDE